MSDIMDDIMGDMGLKDPEPLTNEDRLYDYWVNSKPYAKIHNCEYWLKHELFVYKSLQDKFNFNVYKPIGLKFARVDIKELSRALLRYYFCMVTLPSFENERAAERDKLVDLEKFLDLVMECPVIKNRINNPYKTI